MKEFHPRKIAMINSFAGYGRCSLTVALPVLSAMKVQCCPVPTSILSNHTGFPVYSFEDYTEKIPEYLDTWEKLGVQFDGIVSGFLGSKAQIAMVAEMAERFLLPGGKVIVDPVMGDGGRRYATYTKEMCEAMRRLVAIADVTTPNLTEACILAGREWKETGWKKSELLELAQAIQKLGAKDVVITGIPQGEYFANLILQGEEVSFCRTKKAGGAHHGTGDIFTSIVAACTVRQIPLTRAVRIGAGFVKDCIRLSEEAGISEAEGVCFEQLLGKLTRIA